MKTRKKRGKTGGKWARYGLKRVNKEGTGGINWPAQTPLEACIHVGLRSQAQRLTRPCRRYDFKFDFGEGSHGSGRHLVPTMLRWHWGSKSKL